MSKYIDAKQECLEAERKMTVGKRVETFRLCDEMTQKELADAVGVSVHVIRGIEADEIDITPYKEKICEVLFMDEFIIDRGIEINQSFK